MRRLLIFANPTSGRGRGILILESLTPSLQRAGWGVDVIVEHPAHLSGIPDPQDVDALIVIGGDGTLRAVVDRVTHLLGAENVPPILVMGLGTANLMQRHLGLQYDSQHLAEDVIGLLNRRKIVRVDTAMANDHLFLLMASCGFDAAVVHELASVRTGPITKLTYAAPMLTSLLDYPFHPLTVEVDGQILHADAPAMVFVGNVKEYGTGFPVLDRASSFDQRLDVCIMPCANPYELMQLAMLTLVGKHHDQRGVVYTTGRDIRITSPERIPLQVDGEESGFVPVTIRLLEGRVPFIVR